ncbi:hypothetical protein IMG5_064440 [Ichthyophthirius multifiliis]|uniref:Uncharacterized protein n=1 Tax=Ichthyophthirius multifiliis TaxID=5932 RepID=G0QP59_ICHMU|nr:hypothetical protein IMG5_064440 [Ichthyophthirius multifiliis]EGR32989.1 hypothetical protein IMG5_064440 [Ichthyophthirius multifiliis]|eukprot:XP_004036975.1 hypothetical protein IMG5_064440 [Ichthyophthirius multifiliis]
MIDFIKKDSSESFQKYNMYMQLRKKELQIQNNDQLIKYLPDNNLNSDYYWRARVDIRMFLELKW